MPEYGNGPSTGLDQTAAGKILTGLTRDDLCLSPPDRAVLRRLADRVAAIAASPRMREIRRLWARHNRLEKTRPLFFCDPENGWNEIITEAQMLCRGKLARRWEMDLRKEIFWAEEMQDDKPVEPCFDVPYTVSADDWGLHTEYRQADSLGSYVWEAPLKDYAKDLPKLHAPHFEIDWETTRGCLALARAVFKDSLAVRLKGTWWWSLGLTWPAASLRGLENLLYDFVDHPDELQELLAILSKGYLDKLDYLEANHLLSPNSDGTYVGSGGFGFTDELAPLASRDRQGAVSPPPSSPPLPDRRGSQEGRGQGEGLAGPVRCRDLWGFTESQETVNVSPAMYEKFIFPHEKPIMDRFGLTCYGCCEPLHSRVQVVKRHHQLRRVSCAPWVDVEKMAAALEDAYIFSYKPNPAALALPDIDEQSLRLGLREVLEKTRGCVVEIIMKDNHTLGNRFENAVRWCRLAREEVERLGV